LLKQLRSAPYGEFQLQIAYVDACASRFEELRFDTSPGSDRPGIGKLREGISQVFFMAAGEGEQAIAGEFSGAVLSALRDCYANNNIWPPDPDFVRELVRPKFAEATQHPVQVAWKTKDGDSYREEVCGYVPASDFTHSVASAVGYPVRFLRSLARVAFSCGGHQVAFRDRLYQALAQHSGKQKATRPPEKDPILDLLNIIATAFEWHCDEVLQAAIDEAAFTGALRRMKQLNLVRAHLRRLPTTTSELRKDYLSTIASLAPSQPRRNAATLDAMLDELGQISADDSYHLWEFLLRVVDHHGSDGSELNTLIKQAADPMVFTTILDDIRRRKRFLLSICIEPDFGDEPMPKAIQAKLLVADSLTVVEAFPAVDVRSWSEAELAISDVVRHARKVVLNHRRLEENLAIEFLMPEWFFFEAPDQFQALRPKHERLGNIHSVVLRWRDRILHPYEVFLEPWLEAGERVERTALGTIHWLDHQQCINAAGECQVCSGLAVLSFLPERTQIEMLVEAGFPFIAWLRGAPTLGWQEFQIALETSVRQHPFEELPNEIRKIRRQNSDFGTLLAVFWDDPRYKDHWMPLEEPEYD
jgi:hypothetical protein